jgi:hypothetical protein
MLGRELRDITTNVAGGSMVMSGDGYPRGVYYVRVVTNVRTRVETLVVE